MTSPFVIFFLVFFSIIITAQAGLTAQSRSLALAVKGPFDKSSHVDRRQYFQTRREKYDEKEDYFEDGDRSDHNQEEEGQGEEDMNEYDDDREDRSKWENHKEDNYDDDDDDDDHTSSSIVGKSSSTTSSSYSTASPTWSASWAPSSSSSSMPSLSVPSASAPLVIPSPQPTLTPQRISLLTSQVIKARQRAVDASHSQDNDPSSVSFSWLSPHPGDAFQAGQEVSLQWSSATQASIANYQLRLCVLKSTIDLQQAQNGAFDTSACGLAIPINSSLVPNGLAWQVSFGAPTVTAADSFFAILTSDEAQIQGPTASIGQAAFALPSPLLETRQLQSQIVSPCFVLAPRGIDLSLLNTIPSPSSNAAASPSVQVDQVQQSTAPTTITTRPINWAWIVLPILGISIILIVCGLVYCHRRGQRSARELAEQQSREGEEKWREATRREVNSLAKSTADQAALYSSTPTSLQTFADWSPRRIEIESCSISRPVAPPSDPYTYLPSNLGVPARRLQRNLTTSSSSSTINEDIVPTILPRPLRKAVPYHEEETCTAWTKRVSAEVQSSLPLLARGPSCCSSSASSYSQSSTEAPTLPIPAVLRPRTSYIKAEPLMNPHEASQPRPTSLPVMSRKLYPSAPKSRVLSSSAAEISATTGKIGTAFNCIGTESIHRANQVNDLYLQLKQALQQPPTGNIS